MQNCFHGDKVKCLQGCVGWKGEAIFLSFLEATSTPGSWPLITPALIPSPICSSDSHALVSLLQTPDCIGPTQIIQDNPLSQDLITPTSTILTNSGISTADLGVLLHK